MTTQEWDAYDVWNQALTRHLFRPANADTPVYVDVDVDVLKAAAPQTCSEKEPVAALVHAVRPTLGLAAGETALGVHMARHAAWRSECRRLAGGSSRKSHISAFTAPPTVALLAVCVLAAERMGADSAMAANAYYPRLGDLLGLQADEMVRLRQAFPLTEMFWQSLNEYLVLEEGRLGLPTAYALGFRYVGIPQSQALVRATDRARLPMFFRKFGLAPGSDVVPADLERLLALWVSAEPSPVSANLRRLWAGSAKARERVSGVVAVELSHWDGRGPASEEAAKGGGSGAVELTALLRNQFGRRSVELSFAATLPSPVDAHELTVASAEPPVQIAVMPAPGSRLRPMPGTRLDAGSLVGAPLTLLDDGTAQEAARRPRRVVPLRKDDLLGVFVEAQRVQLAEDNVLLVRDEPSLVSAVDDLLATYGHKGATYSSGGRTDCEALPGLPDGWLLVDDVQVYSVPADPKPVDLQALVPLTTAQLSLARGLRFPGHVRKWSTLDPPEIRAAVSEADRIKVTLRTADAERSVVAEWAEEATALVIPLSELQLEDGDYEIELTVNGNVAVAQKSLRLRSSDTPDLVSWETCTRLAYELDRPGGTPLSALPMSGDSELLVDGVHAIGVAPRATVPVPAPTSPSWSASRPRGAAAQPDVVLGYADPSACTVTGRHRIQLPTYHGRPGRSHLQGVCSGCGLVKVYPARPRWKTNDHHTNTAAPRPPRIRSWAADEDTAPDWDTILDALIHVGGGSMGSLERIATQAQGSALFVDDFLRTLEVVGHVDIRRDERLTAVEWEATPAYLAEVCSKRFLLTGVWSRQMISSLTDAVTRGGGRVVREGGRGQLSGRFVQGLGPADLEEVLSSAAIEATVLPEAAQRLLMALPPLSRMEESLQPIPIPHYASATRFDLATCSWVNVPGIAGPGAYRARMAFRTWDLWVDRRGADLRTAKVATVQLVKHLAARAAGRALVAYYPRDRVLAVPVGADLPGLYGRAAVLWSGRPPSVASGRQLLYHDVPKAAADQLTGLLLS